MVFSPNNAAPAAISLTSVLDNLDAAVYVADPGTYELIFVNACLQKEFGNVLGKKCYAVFQNQTLPCPFCTNKFLFTENGAPNKKVYTWEHYNPVNGHWYELRDQAIHWVDGRIVRLEIAIDITDKKKTEEQLSLAHQELEDKVEQRTRELARSHELLRQEVTERRKTGEELDSRSRQLEEVNIALKVLLQQSSSAQHDLEKRMEANFKKLVLPYLDDLQLALQEKKHKELLNILRENLQQITSAFAVNIHKAETGLTSREIQIASLIKQGKTNKQIAEFAGLSPRTVETYRNRIRRKLGIRNKKINLQTYLDTLSHL